MVHIDNETEKSLLVIHILAKSYPSTNGYTVRSHEIISAQNKIQGLKSIGITSPYYGDIYGDKTEEIIDGVRYIRTINASNSSEIGPVESDIVAKRNPFSLGGIKSFFGYPIRLFYMYKKEKKLLKLFQERIEKLARTMKPDIIHSHTPYKVGLPSMNVAKSLGIPFVYEVRGIWEESAVARGTYKKWGLRYLRFRSMETKVMRGADQIFCLTEEIKANIILRGIPEGKIMVMPNAASSDLLEPLKGELDEDLNRGLLEVKNFKSNSKMIGYVGSIEAYEGLELIIKSLEKLETEGVSIKFLLISNNKGHNSFSSCLSESKIRENILIIGPVKRFHLRNYYDLIDAIVIPRIAESEMAKMVTPLKQMEALALGIPLLITEIPAISRIIGEGTATTFLSGSIDDLSEKIVEIISGNDNVLSRVEKGKTWVKHHANWNVVARDSRHAYDSLLAKFDD